MTDICMPKLGETIADGTITRWLKQAGDSVRAGEPLFEVSTDKVDTEVPAETDGQLGQILVREGETALVGAVVARLLDVNAVATLPSPGGSVGAKAVPRHEPAPASTMAARAPDPASSVEESRSSVPVLPAAAPVEDEARATPLVSPKILAHLTSLGLDARLVPGTGPRGRLTVEDVEAAWQASGGRASVLHPAPSPGRAVPATLAEGTPGAWSSVDVDLGGIERARAQTDPRHAPSPSLVMFVGRAVIDGLREVPALSSAVSTDKEIRLGIVAQGASKPTAIPAASTLRLRALAEAAAAREGQVSSPEMTSTFVLVDAGGSDALCDLTIGRGSPVLTVGRVRRQPTVVAQSDGAEGLAIRTVATLVLGWPSAVVDGLDASRFLGALKTLIEARDWSAELH